MEVENKSGICAGKTSSDPTIAHHGSLPQPTGPAENLWGQRETEGRGSSPLKEKWIAKISFLIGVSLYRSLPSHCRQDGSAASCTEHPAPHPRTLVMLLCRALGSAQSFLQLGAVSPRTAPNRSARDSRTACIPLLSLPQDKELHVSHASPGAKRFHLSSSNTFHQAAAVGSFTRHKTQTIKSAPPQQPCCCLGRNCNQSVLFWALLCQRG